MANKKNIKKKSLVYELTDEEQVSQTTAAYTKNFEKKKLKATVSDQQPPLGRSKVSQSIEHFKINKYKEHNSRHKPLISCKNQKPD